MWNLITTPYGSWQKFTTDRSPLAIHLTLAHAGPNKGDWVARLAGQDEPLYFDAEHSVEAVKTACLDLLIADIAAEMKAVRHLRTKARRLAKGMSSSK